MAIDGNPFAVTKKRLKYSGNKFDISAEQKDRPPSKNFLDGKQESKQGSKQGSKQESKQGSKQESKQGSERFINIRYYFGKYKNTNIIKMYIFYSLNIINSELETREIFIRDYIENGFKKNSVKKIISTLLDDGMIFKVESQTGKLGWTKFRLANTNLAEEVSQHNSEFRRKWRKIKKQIF